MDTDLLQDQQDLEEDEVNLAVISDAAVDRDSSSLLWFRYDVSSLNYVEWILMKTILLLCEIKTIYSI